MKEKKRVIIGILIIVFAMVGFASATVTCDPISDISYPEGITTNQEANFQCTNSFESNAVTLTKGGSASPYFSLDETVIGQSTNVSESVKTFNIDFDEDAVEGNYVGTISFSDGSSSLSFLLTVIKPQGSGGCQINPSLVSYTQQIQQGTKIALPKITFNPINCDSPLILTASSVSIQGGIVTPEGQKPVFISSVESDGVNMDIDAEGLNSQTYNSKLKISAFGKQFEIPFTIIITGGTSTTGNFDVNNLPKCSLTNNIININDTHSLVCTNLIPDVKILPDVDSYYIRGINLEKEANQFVWLFQGKRFGNTFIKADFYYLGVPVGDPFEQEVKIQSQSGALPGTFLKLLFTPELSIAKDSETIAIQIVDNGTKSLVEGPNLFIDAISVVNSSERTFFYSFAANKNYSIRAVAAGYNDWIETISLESTPITLTISPEGGDTNTIFTITSNVNATIYVNGEIKEKEFIGTLIKGNNTVRAIKEGFFEVEKTVFVKEALNIFGPLEIKKGELQTFTLNKNSTWKVSYQKDADSEIEIYAEGEGGKIEFEPSKSGTYIVEAGDAKKVFVIEGFDWKQKFLLLPVYGWLIFVILVIVIFIFVRNRQGSSESDDVPFGVKVRS